jgi:hypothetical protein
LGRADSLAKLAWAYAVHQVRRQFSFTESQLTGLLDTYAVDGIRPLAASEQERHPQLVTCINCGLCALAAGRIGRTRLPDLASSYMRLYARLGEASSDIEDGGVGAGPDLAAASAACPVGLPLEEVAAVVRRLSKG